MRIVRRLPAWITVSISFVLLLFLWQAVVKVADTDRFILPSPVDVGRQFHLQGWALVQFPVDPCGDSHSR